MPFLRAMETRKIDTTDYFMIGWQAYFADNIWDFMVLRDKDPWELYYRESQGPFMYVFDKANTIQIGDEPGWVQVDIEGNKLKNYFEHYAKPETWKHVSKKFYEIHQIGGICDGASLSIEFKKPNGKVKEMHYFMDEFPEEWHPSYQKASRLLRYLERHTGAAKKQFAFFYANR